MSEVVIKTFMLWEHRGSIQASHPSIPDSNLGTSKGEIFKCLLPSSETFFAKFFISIQFFFLSAKSLELIALRSAKPEPEPRFGSNLKKSKKDFLRSSKFKILFVTRYKTFWILGKLWFEKSLKQLSKIMSRRILMRKNLSTWNHTLILHRLISVCFPKPLASDGLSGAWYTYSRPYA